MADPGFDSAHSQPQAAPHPTSSTHGLWALGWELDSLLHLLPPETPQVRRQPGVREPGATQFPHGSAPPPRTLGRSSLGAACPFERRSPADVCSAEPAGAGAAASPEPEPAVWAAQRARAADQDCVCCRLSGLPGETADGGLECGKADALACPVAPEKKNRFFLKKVLKNKNRSKKQPRKTKKQKQSPAQMGPVSRGLKGLPRPEQSEPQKSPRCRVPTGGKINSPSPPRCKERSQ